MRNIDAVLARLERLETENGALRARVDELEGPSGVRDHGPADQVSRRDLLRRAGTGMAAVGMGALAASVATLVQASPASAANGETITVGGTFHASSPTTIDIDSSSNSNSVLIVNSSGGGAVEGNATSGTGVRGTSNSGAGAFGNSSTGTGVLGESTSGLAIHGMSGSSDGVFGESLTGIGVHGKSLHDDAVYGETIDGTGVSGQSSGAGVAVSGVSQSSYGVYGQSRSLTGISGLCIPGIGVEGAGGDIGTVGASVSGPNSGQGTGILGISGFSTLPARSTRTDIGVMGVSAHGRGGVFTGPVAQVRLTPSTAVTHPTSGARGDFFLDRSGRLWFCKGGTSWKQLA